MATTTAVMLVDTARCGFSEGRYIYLSAATAALTATAAFTIVAMGILSP